MENAVDKETHQTMPIGGKATLREGRSSTLLHRTRLVVFFPSSRDRLLQ